MKTIIKYSLFLFMSIISLKGHCQSLNILILGSTNSVQLEYKTMDPYSIAEQLDSILANTSSISSYNVVVKDIYKNKVVQTAFGGSGALTSFSYYSHSLFQHYFWPDDKVNNHNDLMGDLNYDWDHIILLEDPYIITNAPGYHALGVNKVLSKIKEGGAQPHLFLQWPDKNNQASIDHFEEVTYRISDGALDSLPVIPAGLAWATIQSSFNDEDSSAEFPSPNGSYLAAASIFSHIFNQSAAISNYTYDDDIANHTHLVSQQASNEQHYSGEFTFVSPFSRCTVKPNVVNFNHTGSSTENGIEAGFRWVMQNEQAFEENNFNRKFHLNYGRANYNWEAAKRYKIDPETYSYSFGHPMQFHSSTGINPNLYGIDHWGSVNNNGADLSVGRYFLNIDSASNGRVLPMRSIVAEMVDQDSTQEMYSDSWHLHPNVNAGGGSYMYTLLTGRCGQESNDPNTSADGSYFTGVKVGYEMAWTMMHLKSKAPGFRVLKGNKQDTLIDGVSTKYIDVHFLNPPTDSVFVNVSSSVPNVISFDNTQLIFTPQNYNTPQRVYLSPGINAGVNDTASAVFTCSSNDIFYDNFSDLWNYRIYGTVTNISSDINLSNIIIYPSPVNNVLNISGVEASDVFSIYSMQGSLLVQGKGNTVNVSNLSRGIYSIRIIGKEQTIIKKFLKQ
ncbi:T9SS type A sorting domain-containing protein [Vicingus serpentipes]|uniref:T9SS type A sorting domain-containing protein n=1 Tax=Vicingus serpentipes TaxID=1926625 RepID=A0A5C6RN68_9FLAO|nr:T9SS type A sorting domain-containing protein [Vicingus serpentipes]TXB63858.1 T9SS type A sorting domain-containing protein [Vicingus serpentipes]